MPSNWLRALSNEHQFVNHSKLAIVEWNGANSDLVEHYELELFPEHGSIEYSKRNQMKNSCI